MKTELSRRTLLQIPLLAAVSAAPSITDPGEYLVVSSYERIDMTMAEYRAAYYYSDASAELYADE